MNSPSPKILFLDQSGKMGGAEFFLGDLAHRLSERCEVVTFEKGPFNQLLAKRGVRNHVEPIGVTYTKEEKRPFSVLWKIPKLLLACLRLRKRARKFDIVYGNTPKSAVVGGIVALLANRPFVYHLHDILSPEHFSRINLRLLISIANRRSQVVICNSEATRSAYASEGGKPQLAKVVFNGFEPEAFKPPAADTLTALKNEIVGPKNVDSPIALISGRLTRWKGQHVFLAALASVRELHGVIAGDALFTAEDQKYAGELRNQARNLGIENQVHFLGFRSDMVNLYHAADIVVHGSTAPEPFGRVIVEGMLCRKPVIATNQGGACEILKHDRTGLLVEPENPEALADSLSLLIHSPSLRESLGEAAFQDALERFSLDQVVSQIEEILEEVVT